jgi:hypothetical protein
MSTIGYVVRGLPRAYVELYRTLNRTTGNVVPMLGGFVVFWLVPGVPAMDALTALRTGQAAPPVSRRHLAVAWTLTAVAIVWAAWRRWYA